MLQLKKLSFKHIFRGIDLSLEAGRLYPLLGRNGVGKTTLLKALAYLHRPLGSVLWRGKDLALLSRKELSKLITFVPQGGVIPFPFKVKEFVEMGRYAHGQQGDVGPILDRVGITALKDQRIDQISHGERQKVYIARGLATEAPLVLLDEPTAHLDVESQEKVWRLMKDLSQKGYTLICATHDLHWSNQFGDRLLHLQDGKLTMKTPHLCVQEHSSLRL